MPADGGNIGIVATMKAKRVPGTKLTKDESRRLSIFMHASNLALRDGGPTARRDANKVARVLGFAKPFGERVDAIHWKALDGVLRAAGEPVDDEQGEMLKRLRTPTTEEEAEAYGLQVCSYVLHRAYQGVGWARVRSGEVDVAVVAKAINRVFGLTGQKRWSKEDTLIQVLRAAYRALGGTAANAQKFLRERDPATPIDK